MNSASNEQENEEQGDIFLDESDIIQEIPFDDEGTFFHPLYTHTISLFFCLIHFLWDVCGLMNMCFVFYNQSFLKQMKNMGILTVMNILVRRI